MISAIVFGALAIANAEIIRVPFGALNVNVGTGSNVPEKYKLFDSADDAASAAATRWGNDVLKHATTGIDGIPVLDPYYENELPPIMVQHTHITGLVVLKNLNITGIKEMELQEFKVRLKNKRWDVSVTGPALNVEVDYDAVINLGFLPVSYHGHASVSLKGVNGSAAARVTKKLYKGVPVFQLEGLQLEVHVDDVQIAIDKVLWSTISGVMSNDQVIDETAVAVANSLLSEGNKILRHTPAKSVLQYLLVRKGKLNEN